jgi:type III pantothenate kinase
MDTILLLDVGNTNVKIGVARPGQGVLATYALPTSTAGSLDTADAWGLKLLDICRVEDLTPGQVLDIVAASVVPPMNPVIRRAAERFFHRAVRFVPGDGPADIRLPIENRYARPQEVGADRLVTAYAARCREKAHTLVVVDFGTATTLDCVQGCAYLGGLICPGVLSSARALATGTAKLPQISLELGQGPLHVGKSTSESLNQGLIHGFAAMVEGLSRRIAESVGASPEETRVIATGGFAKPVAAVCPAIDDVREDLLMEGLMRAWEGSH